MPENMEVFYVNVCGDTHDGCEDDKHAGNCQLAADGNYYPCGDASKQSWYDCMLSRKLWGVNAASDSMQIRRRAQREFN